MSWLIAIWPKASPFNLPNVATRAPSFGMSMSDSL
jgi:hypothetical protein